MEETYKTNFFKSFKRQIDEAYFNFIIVDAIFDKAKNVDDFWSYAMSKGFQVYVIEAHAEVNVCAKRNIHSRGLREIRQVGAQVYRDLLQTIRYKVKHRFVLFINKCLKHLILSCMQR